MKHLLIFVFIFAVLLLPLPVFSQALPFQSAVANLYHMNEKTINEIVYLHTDREVYAPADTLWFTDDPFPEQEDLLSGRQHHSLYFLL